MSEIGDICSMLQGLQVGGGGSLGGGVSGIGDICSMLQGLQVGGGGELGGSVRDR